MAVVARKRITVGFVADFSEVEAAIGNAWGVLNAIDNLEYQNALMKNAFNTAVLDFNTEAAAYAASGGSIKHMYEWGTVGINKGRTNVRPNPMSDRARLWEPVMTGQGFNRQLDFFYKPSLAYVPKPTTAETGISQDVIASLRDHVFENKAMVFETGTTVTIRPVEAQFLLIPLYRDREYHAARPSDYARGYMLQNGPNVMRPGARTSGNFTAYWTQFWEGRGNVTLNETVQKELDTDYALAMAEAKGHHTMRPAIPGAVVTAITKDRKRQERNAVRRAQRAAKKAEEVRRAQ